MTPTNKKLLIIEDDAIIANIYRNKFEKAGYIVEVMNDGQSGFYRIFEDKPHAVLLDLMLPKMNGVELLQKIKAQKRFEKLPVFVFTNAYLSDYALEASKAGALKVFNKASTTPQQILDAINSVLILSPGQSETSFTSMPASGYTPPPGGAAATIPAPVFSPANLPSPPMTPTSYSPPPLPPPPSSGIAMPHSAMPTFPGNPAPLPLPIPQAQSPQPTTPVAAAAALHGETMPPAAPSTDWGSFGSENDAAFFADLQKNFVQTVPESVATLRKEMQAVSQSPTPEARNANLQELFRKLHSLGGSASMIGFGNVTQMSTALEAFVNEMMTKPQMSNASTQRTLAMAIDFLCVLMRLPNAGGTTNLAETKILVVDDDMICRRAVIYALSKASLQAVGVDNPSTAYKMMSETRYDMVFLDVSMPEMDGFELCTKLRGLPAYKSTPVIFVTSMTDFENRAKSILSGGNELIGKPFPFLELAVKALACILKSKTM